MTYSIVRQKGFAPLVIILAITILGVVGYFGYKNYWPKLQSVVAPIPATTSDTTANWKTYANTRFGYSVKYFPTLSTDIDDSYYSQLFENVPNSGFFRTPLPDLYISVIPNGFKNTDYEVYNFMPANIIDQFFNMKIGSTLQTKKSEFAKFSTYKKIADTNVANLKGTTVENYNVFSYNGTERRVFIKKGNYTYMIGTYYTDLNELENFQKSLSTFKFLK
ncbi:MAG: hypothetical protein Q8P91_03460 [bacterium]|nr:hypothetical protein [bacterium]